MCVGFVHDQFDLFIILSISRLKHDYAHTRAMLMIILCLQQITKATSYIQS